MRRPICVITGDIHFTPGTLELASSVVGQGLTKSAELGVPFVMNGDTLDTKAVMRGECVNRLIELISDAPGPVIINRGNHDQLHERSEEHTLNFLRPYAEIVQAPVFEGMINSWIIPYQHDPEEFERIMSTIPKGATVIVHQGVIDSDMGHYSHDHSAVPKSVFADYRGIGSHYHRAQDIKCGRPRKGAVGLFSYCGSPYTISFAEAGDGPKGFQILYDDGLMEQVPTNLRRHIVFEVILDDIRGLCVYSRPVVNPDDLVWVKLTGSRMSLDRVDKDSIGKTLGLPPNYRLDKIPTDTAPPVVQDIEKKSGIEVLDELIDTSDEAEAERTELKRLARETMG